MLLNLVLPQQSLLEVTSTKDLEMVINKTRNQHGNLHKMSMNCNPINLHVQQYELVTCIVYSCHQ